MSSEFGEGYITCLWQFANHSGRLTSFPRMGYIDYVGLWFNGSSDHLYDLRRPQRGVPRDEWLAAHKIASDALTFGHGYPRPRNPTEAEAKTCIQRAIDLVLAVAVREGVGYPMTLEEAMALDRRLGLLPDGGSWNCPDNIW